MRMINTLNVWVKWYTTNAHTRKKREKHSALTYTFLSFLHSFNFSVSHFLVLSIFCVRNVSAYEFVIKWYRLWNAEKIKPEHVCQTRSHFTYRMFLFSMYTHTNLLTSETICFTVCLLKKKISERICLTPSHYRFLSNICMGNVLAKNVTIQCIRQLHWRKS